MFINKFILILYNVEISGNDASRIYHSLLLQKPMRQQHWKPKNANMRRKRKCPKELIESDIFSGRPGKGRMEAGFKEEVDGNYRYFFVLHIFHQQAKLQRLTSDAETLAIFRLCDTSKSGSISARVSWRCNQREVKKIQFSMWHWYFLKVCLLPFYFEVMINFYS